MHSHKASLHRSTTRQPSEIMTILLVFVKALSVWLSVTTALWGRDVSWVKNRCFHKLPSQKGARSQLVNTLTNRYSKSQTDSILRLSVWHPGSLCELVGRENPSMVTGNKTLRRNWKVCTTISLSSSKLEGETGSLHVILSPLRVKNTFPSLPLLHFFTETRLLFSTRVNNLLLFSLKKKRLKYCSVIFRINVTLSLIQTTLAQLSNDSQMLRELARLACDMFLKWRNIRSAEWKYWPRFLFIQSL